MHKQRSQMVSLHHDAGDMPQVAETPHRAAVMTCYMHQDITFQVAAAYHMYLLDLSLGGGHNCHSGVPPYEPSFV